MTEQKTPYETSAPTAKGQLEQWQIEALQVLLEMKVKEVEAGERVYLSSGTYGNSRYHLVDKRYDGVQVEQVDIEEKWNKRINLYSDEIPALLKILLTWHLEDVRQANEIRAAAGSSGDDVLGDLDDHPF